MQDAYFDEFLQKVKDGSGNKIDHSELELFVSIMPSIEETMMFKDRLEENDLKSFDDLENLKHPKTLKKLDRAEQLIIKILKNSEVMEKSRLLQKLINIDSILDMTDDEYQSWIELHKVFSGDSSK